MRRFCFGERSSIIDSWLRSVPRSRRCCATMGVKCSAWVVHKPSLPFAARGTSPNCGCGMIDSSLQTFFPRSAIDAFL